MLGNLIYEGGEIVNDFDAIYQQYGKTVYCFLLSLSRDESLAEELTQETMFRAIMNINYWWGFASGAVDVQLAPSVPDGPRELLRVLREALVHGELTPFHRRITDQAGTLRNDGEQWFSPETILRMDWLCSNVTGKIPDYEELLPMAQPMVRLLGVYRDALQPKKRGPLL